MKHLGDITKINGAEIEIVDVITGGSPCQDLSIAGKRAGLAGARSGLFMEQVRIVKEMREHDRANGRTGDMVRPRFMVWENVPGAFSSNKGRDFAAVLEEIIRIAEPEAPDIEVPEKGWPTWGATTMRWEDDGAWLGECMTRNTGESPNAAVGSRLSQILEATPQEKYSLSAKACQGILRRAERRGKDLPETLKAVLLMQSEQGGSVMGVSHDVSGTLRAQEHGHQPAVMAFDTTQITSKQNGSIPDFGKPCHTLNANAHVPCAVIRDCGEIVPSLQARMGTGGNQVPLTYQMNGFGDYRAAEVASSCKQRDFKDSTDLAITHMIVRRLTPMECERLQGFPDHWTDIGEWRDSKGKLRKPSDSPRYKALGNSIALPFWDFLAKRISAQYLRPVTMGSLFDGIGGFPLVFERHNGKGTARWASEIEEFPIAVTKKWFGEE